jgi:two-component system sensor histidine kinase CreC
MARREDVVLEPPPPDVTTNAWCDPDLLEEALVNILENAVEFSPPGAAVDVELESGDDAVRVLVRDRGPGLPDGDAGNLFRQFSQGPRSPWARREGLGLGLYIASVHLGLMAGDLAAGNHRDGGAVFTCSLRREPPDPGESR